MTKYKWLLIFLAILAGGLLAWWMYKPVATPQDLYESFERTEQTSREALGGVQEILAIPQQVRQEVKQGAMEIQTRIVSFSDAERIAELERIISIGNRVLSEGDYRNVQ